ncbi:Aminopeptidase N [Acromyrmex echinatior]|uniref:Aminopeptidase N n=1 Tax=Acromyrmex echinatior TaxID=103372 RepID=F4W553_ACREC|nr:Aminopeptidase N [Acromyrmex echinatior]
MFYFRKTKNILHVRLIIIIYREANLIYNETLDTVMRKMEIAHLIAPKIAYQWFSNLLSSVWFHYWWLHDGLATMFGEEAVVKVFIFINIAI